MSEQQSPSARLVHEAQTPTIVTDSQGRRLTLRRMGVLERLRLFKAVGGELAANEAYLGMAYLACAVSDIDGVPVPVPVHEAGIEALVQRLDEHGLAAVGLALAEADAARSANPGN